MRTLSLVDCITYYTRILVELYLTTHTHGWRFVRQGGIASILVMEMPIGAVSVPNVFDHSKICSIVRLLDPRQLSEYLLHIYIYSIASIDDSAL